MTEIASFGQYVALARKEKGYSDRKLGKLTGVAHTTIGRIEDGAIPAPDLLISLIDTLGLDTLTAVRLVEPYNRLYRRIIAAQKEAK